jgi:hypothetical protein
MLGVRKPCENCGKFKEDHYVVGFPENSPWQHIYTYYAKKAERTAPGIIFIYTHKHAHTHTHTHTQTHTHVHTYVYITS